MKHGVIGNATNVLGNTFNIIMSNATTADLEGFFGNLDLPANSIIIVNPLNEKGEDIGWHDICVTDSNKQDMGVVSILPFTSIDKESGLTVISVKDNTGNETGERMLTLSGQANISGLISDAYKELEYTEVHNPDAYAANPDTAPILFEGVKKGDTYEQAISKLDNNINNLINETLDNELVCSSAINQHNLSCGFDENAKYVQNKSNSIISDANSLTDAINIMASYIERLEQRIRQLEQQPT